MNTKLVNSGLVPIQVRKDHKTEGISQSDWHHIIHKWWREKKIMNDISILLDTHDLQKKIRYTNHVVDGYPCQLGVPLMGEIIYYLIIIVKTEVLVQIWRWKNNILQLYFSLYFYVFMMISCCLKSSSDKVMMSNNGNTIIGILLVLW